MNTHKNFFGGFTMVELLVTVAIFTVITSILVVNYPKFSSKIILENVAHDIGLSIREAQSFGLNVRAFGTGSGALFPSYGAHFSLRKSGDPADERHFLLFADIFPDPEKPTKNDKKYGTPADCTIAGGECVNLFSIQSSEKIYLLCGNLKSKGATIDNWQSVSGTDCALTTLDITYTRPNPEASIIGGGGLLADDTIFDDAEIVVRSSRGDIKMVVVWNTGQIAVE